MNEKQIEFMRQAIQLAMDNIIQGGGPFAALVVKNDQIISRGVNQVTLSNDPTAHAEVTAIRAACAKLGDFQLEDCDLYTTCEPCPMCLGAIYWARPRQVFYANTQLDAAKIGFDDQFIYEEIACSPKMRKIPMHSLLRQEALKIFKSWEEKPDKLEY